MGDRGKEFLIEHGLIIVYAGISGILEQFSVEI